MAIAGDEMSRTGGGSDRQQGQRQLVDGMRRAAGRVK